MLELSDPGNVMEESCPFSVEVLVMQWKASQHEIFPLGPVLE